MPRARENRRIRFTDRLVDAIKTEKATSYFDKDNRGLCLRVTPSGAKSWSFVYRLPGKPSQWLRLGSYPAMSLAKARTEALKHRFAIESEGRDPVAEGKAQKAATSQPQAQEFTFADMVGVYVAFAKGVKKTWQEDEAKCKRHLLPKWGKRSLVSITKRDVNELLDNLIADGMTVGCNRIQALVSRIFSVAINRDLADVNPAARIFKRADETKRDRVLSDDEIRELWAALTDPSNETPRGHASAILLRLLTGQRGGEIANMRREDVSLPRAEWTIPAAHAKNGRAHVVPLSPTTKGILASRIDSLTPNEPRVFPGLTTRAMSSERWAQIHGGRYEWHDLRRTVATRLVQMTIDEATVARVLNHARSGITARVYNQHAYTDEKRVALDAWDRMLIQIVEGNTARTPVLPFMLATA